MRNRRSPLLASLAISCVFWLAACATEGSALRGKLEGPNYTSAREWFHMTAPPARPGPRKIVDQSTTGDAASDDVTFLDLDFGCANVVGAVEFPQWVRDQIAADGPQLALQKLSKKLLLEWRQFPEEPQPLTLDYFASANGPALLRVYRAPKGSLLSKSVNGGPTQHFDAMIGVAVTRLENHVLYAIAESDVTTESNPKAQDAVASLTRELFNGITIGPALKAR